MISYKITSYDLKGSIKPQGPKGRVQDIELPEDAVPIGFDTVIKDATTKGELFDWAFYPTVKGSESWQREWLDDEHTEFVCVIDGILKRYWVITRVYCMSPKAAAGVPVPEVPVKRRSSGVQEIEDIMQALNAVVDSKDHSEVLRLIEAAKEKLGSFDRIRCPVCDGRGTLPYGFYHDQPRDATGAGPTTQCRSCMGRGIGGV